VGALEKLASGFDLEIAFAELSKREGDAEARRVLASKQTLLTRPIARLLANPHVLGGFLGRYDGELFRVRDGEPVFEGNPVSFLAELYRYLHMEENPGTPPSEKIWSDDGAMLEDALHFYDAIAERTGVRDGSGLEKLFSGERDDRLAGGDDALWHACVAAHRGHQAGLELLLLIPRIGIRSAFSEITVDESLEVVFPPRFLDAERAAEDTKALAPPPPASADEIVTPMGGAYYAREAPHLPPMIEVGEHFEAGQPLFIIEVMKMFNKVLAPFAGTVTENPMEGKDGTVVAKGQTIFKIEPDERVVPESEAERAARVREATLALLS
jgi:biotin carboxyl carrier protein